MNTGLISRRYAKALYEYASEHKVEDVLYRRMQMLVNEMNMLPKLKVIFRNPTISSVYKKVILTEVTGTNPEPVYLDFVRLVTDNHREQMAWDIALNYQMVYRQKKNISIVNLTSAVPMNDAALERIKKQVQQKTNGQVEFKTRIDPALEGGFIFQLDDMQIDASVKGQLEKIRRKLI
ncbi:MAG: F0F1 ATP synthase subunit delta [Bacteroidales bacterium]|jgi:F-type H+-transporting ATPase subunit delta|nr:F0F1 ATP synthase subunit delta [Bacteroidales bacterium]